MRSVDPKNEELCLEFSTKAMRDVEGIVGIDRERRLRIAVDGEDTPLRRNAGRYRRPIFGMIGLLSA